MVYPVGLTRFITRWISRTERGPPSHKTLRISSSATVGLGFLEVMALLLTKVFVTVNEILRQVCGGARRGLRERLASAVPCNWRALTHEDRGPD